MRMSYAQVEALKYIASGDYRRIGLSRSDLTHEVSGLRLAGLVKNEVVGSSVKIVLTPLGQGVLSTLAK